MEISAELYCKIIISCTSGISRESSKLNSVIVSIFYNNKISNKIGLISVIVETVHS